MYRNKLKINILLTIITLIFIFPTICFADDTVFVWSTETQAINNAIETSSNIIDDETNTSLSSNTVQTNSNITSLNLDCGSCILVEQHSGQILYEQNMHEQLRPASVTKIMSILLIMEAIDSGKISYTDKVPCSENAAGMGGSQIWLDVREELTVDEMLKAICVVSANDRYSSNGRIFGWLTRSFCRTNE